MAKTPASAGGFAKEETVTRRVCSRTCLQNLGYPTLTAVIHHIAEHGDLTDVEERCNRQEHAVVRQVRFADLGRDRFLLPRLAAVYRRATILLSPPPARLRTTSPWLASRKRMAAAANSSEGISLISPYLSSRPKL